MNIFASTLVTTSQMKYIMKLQTDNYKSNISTGVTYFFLVITGILIILFCSFIQHIPSPARGEYYYSTYLKSSYTLVSICLFFIAGFMAGYLYKLNPFFVGICLFLIFPVTSIIEAIVYKGSHNLIPFEFAVYFIYALPSIIAAFIGRYVFKQLEKRKGKINGEVIN